MAIWDPKFIHKVTDGGSHLLTRGSVAAALSLVFNAGPWPTGADTWALRQLEGTYKGYSLPYTHGGT